MSTKRSRSSADSCATSSGRGWTRAGSRRRRAPSAACGFARRRSRSCGRSGAHPSAARPHAHRERSLGRGRRVRSHRVPAEGSRGDRGHGQRARRRVRGAGGADREGAGRAIRGGGGRPAPDRTHRGTLGPPGRRIVAMGGRSTPGRSAGPRDHPAPLAPRSRADDPQVLAGADHAAATSGPARQHGSAHAGVPGRLCPRSDEHDRQRRHRQRQDHAARRAVAASSPTTSV